VIVSVTWLLPVLTHVISSIGGFGTLRDINESSIDIWPCLLPVHRWFSLRLLDSQLERLSHWWSSQTHC